MTGTSGADLHSIMHETSAPPQSTAPARLNDVMVGTSPYMALSGQVQRKDVTVCPKGRGLTFTKEQP